METQKIEAHKIKKPIQLMAVWFIALIFVDSVFLTAATKIQKPPWLAPSLGIAAIIFVPLFLLGVFLMQTVFRKELQEDQYYAEWLKRQEEMFKGFDPENIKNRVNATPLVTMTAFQNTIRKKTVSVELDSLEKQRISLYEKNEGLFLTHSWRPSIISGQIADIVIWLQQHGEGPLSRGEVESVEYQLGPKFFDGPKIKTNLNELFRLEVSAYGPTLCLAQVHVKGKSEPILLERYINFEIIPQVKPKTKQTTP